MEKNEGNDSGNSKKHPDAFSPAGKAAAESWTDICESFKIATQDLMLGELLHDESFGLFEAMSAIEMMDPKMDTGLLCNRGNQKIMSFDEAQLNGKLKLDQLSAEELIGIIDATYSYFVSWLEGHSLAQTVFTNLYMHKPYEIKEKSLKVFTMAFYKILDCVHDFIYTASVFEEEDFQLAMYGFFLVPSVNEQKIISLLKEVEDEIYKKTKFFDSTVVKNQYIAKPDVALALHARIKATRTFYSLLLLIDQMKKDKRDVSYSETLKAIAHLNESLAIMKNSLHFGLKYNALGFEPMVNQRLLPPTFPRYTKVKPAIEAIRYLEEFLERLKFAVKIQLTPSFHNTIDLFIEFIRSRPCILSRSILQLLYFGNSLSGYPLTPVTVLTNVPFVDVLKDACRNFISPPSLSPFKLTPNVDRAVLTDCESIVNGFFKLCVRPFKSMIQLYGHNHARQREKLANLLSDFASLQDEAERVDVFLHNQYLATKTGRPHIACYGTWVLYHTLQVMIMYLLSGFELELYSTYEFYYIYWYMYEFLYGWLTSALNRAEYFMTWSGDANDASFSASANSSKARQCKKNKLKKRKNSVKPYEKEIAYYQCLQNICGGFYKGFFGLKCSGFLKLPCNEFSRESIRFEHRFSPFKNLLTPPPVSYKEFSDVTGLLHTSDTKVLYEAATDHFKQARAAIENMNPDKEMTSLLKVVKWNYVVFKILAGGRKPLKTPLELDFSEHSVYPLIKLQI